MHILEFILRVILMADVAAFVACWLGGAACFLVVIVEDIRSAGTVGPRFATQFMAQSRDGQLSTRSQSAMQWMRRLRRWANRVWWVGVGSIAVGVACALLLHHLQPHARP